MSSLLLITTKCQSLIQDSDLWIVMAIFKTGCIHVWLCIIKWYLFLSSVSCRWFISLQLNAEWKKMDWKNLNRPMLLFLTLLVLILDLPGSILYWQLCHWPRAQDDQRAPEWSLNCPNTDFYYKRNPTNTTSNGVLWVCAIFAGVVPLVV